MPAAGSRPPGRTARRVSVTVPGRRSFLLLFSRAAKPSEGGPGLEPSLNLRWALVGCDGAFAQSRADSARERLAGAQFLQDQEFFALEATEIHGIVDAMHCEKNRRRLQPRHSPFTLLLVALVEGIAREIRI